MDMFTQNSKMSKSSGGKYRVMNFGIPAFKSASGFKTCPMAGTCAKGCYAQQSAYNYPAAKNAYEARLALTQRADFAAVAQVELDAWKRRAAKKGQKLIVRWHDSGDFYNAEYAIKCLTLFRNNPDVTFYAYTKMVPLFNRLQAQGVIPANFTLIYSFGGVADSLIKESDRHARVFDSLESLKAAGYVNAMDNDLRAIGDNHKVGLIYHGYKSRGWTTPDQKNTAKVA